MKSIQTSTVYMKFVRVPSKCLLWPGSLCKWPRLAIVQHRWLNTLWHSHLSRIFSPLRILATGTSKLIRIWSRNFKRSNLCTMTDSDDVSGVRCLLVMWYEIDTRRQFSLFAFWVKSFLHFSSWIRIASVRWWWRTNILNATIHSIGALSVFWSVQRKLIANLIETNLQ